MSDAETNVIHTGDVRDRLKDLPANSIHMGMTSPPYFGLRDYGEGEQIGLEESLDEYIAELVGVFDEVRRVLRPDGSFWLNLGDSYQDKQKLMVPHRVAIALQDNGWIVRNDVTWLKPNPMPSPVKDRLNTQTEQIFHLTPDPDYWYDLDAIREPHAESTRDRMGKGYRNTGDGTDKRNREDSPGTNNRGGGMNEPGIGFDESLNDARKNPGDVFEVTTKPFPDAHFAVYPPELCEKPIKATCPPKVCAECGAPYEREVEIERSPGSSPGKSDGNSMVDAQVNGGHQRDGHDYKRTHISNVETVGWNQTCDCDTDATEAGIALDPFAGAGTTCLVAKEQGRRFVGVELNPEYVAMAQKRLGLTVENPEYIRDDGDAGLEDFA